MKMRTRHWSMLPRLGLILVSIGGGMSVFAEDRPIARGILEVPSDTLSEMRGRYLDGRHDVMYFGVRMISEWRTAAGYQLSAGARLSVDRSGADAIARVSFAPELSIARAAAETGTTTGVISNRGIDVTGADNVTGISQRVHIAGDHNQVENLMRIRFVDEIPVTSGLIAPNASEERSGMHLSAGLSLRFEPLVTIVVDDHGRLEQAIQGTEHHGGSGLRQVVELLGDRHQVNNQLELSVNLRDRAVQPPQRAGAAIEALRGIGAR